VGGQLIVNQDFNMKIDNILPGVGLIGMGSANG
jgi:hypothetical protein